MFVNGVISTTNRHCIGGLILSMKSITKKFCLIFTAIRVSNSHCMYGRQKYSFSSKHMSTKLEGSPSTRNDCRTHHITTTTSGRFCYPQLLLDWSRMLSTMSDKYNKYFFISINCRLSPFHGYLSTLIQLTEYVLNINRRLTGTGYVNKLRIRKDKR